jgi:cleavage and polyadenylation specificity factor subunit 2
MEEEKARKAPEPPSKFVSDSITLDLHASVEYVDMDGLHDGQAIKTIIADLQPRRVVVVQSTPESTEALVAFCHSIAKDATATDVFQPGTNEVVQIGEHIQSYTLQLGESIKQLLNRTKAKFEGYEVAMVDAKLAFASGSTVPVLEDASVELPPAMEAKEEVEGGAEAEAKPQAEGEAAEGEAAEGETAVDGDITMDATPETAEVEAKTEPEPEVEAEVKAEPEPKTESDAETVREATPTRALGPARLPGSLFIGDLRLLHLKNRLASLSIPAEFAGEGMLVCGPGVLSRRAGDKKASGAVVAVRKLGEGEVVLEGAISATYFTVRKELYGSYAQVTTV